MGASAAVWIIFAVLVVAGISFLVFIIIKDRRSKKKIKVVDIQTQTISEIEFKKVIIKMALIIKKNQQEMENFRPSVGSFSMGDLNNISKELVSQILGDSNYRQYIKGKDQYKELDDNINLLYKNKPSTWAKTFPKTIEYFVTNNIQELKTTSNEIASFQKSYLKEIHEFYELNNI